MFIWVGGPEVLDTVLTASLQGRNFFFERVDQWIQQFSYEIKGSAVGFDTSKINLPVSYMAKPGMCMEKAASDKQQL